MKKALLPGLLFGTAMAVGTAQAEPLTLTADQMDGVTAGGNAFVNAQKNVDINERINKHVDIRKFKDVFQFVNVTGWFAEADGAANCSGGFGCEALTYAIVDVVQGTNGYATSVSGAEAATDDFHLDFSNGNNSNQ